MTPLGKGVNFFIVAGKNQEKGHHALSPNLLLGVKTFMVVIIRAISMMIALLRL